MPILSRFLRKYNPQTRVPGTANVREVHKPAVGPEITRDYRTTKTKAEVEADMNARDLTETLSERDFGEVLAWVLAGNDPNTFDYTDRDAIKNKAEERITKTFARSRGEDAIALSWWIAGLGNPRWTAIVDRLAWDNARKTRVKNRAVSLNAVIADLNDEEDV